MSDFLQLLDPKLRRIADRQSYERIHEIARRFPGGAFYYLGFERPLGYYDSGLDFSFNLAPPGIARAPADYGGDIAEAIASGVASIPNTDAIWLEFDTSAEADTHLRPNVFIPFQRRNAPNAAEYTGLAEFLSLLPPSLGTSADRLERLKRYLECAPSSVERIFVGFMLGRRSRAMRLYLMQFCGVSEVCAFLGAIGWGGPIARVQGVLAPYESSIDVLNLHLDLSGAALDSAGFELYAGGLHELAPQRGHRWERLFECLAENGLCIPQVSSQLLDWCSETNFEAPLIERLIWAAQPSDERLLHGTLRTGINDVKISVSADGRAQAKAYFGALLEG